MPPTLRKPLATEILKSTWLYCGFHIPSLIDKINVGEEGAYTLAAVKHIGQFGALTRTALRNIPSIYSNQKKLSMGWRFEMA
jgi:hypothetical protein